VVAGLSDGGRTHIVAGELRPGDVVVVGAEQEGDGEGASKPFLRKRPGGKKP
jgi:hypothetical protein